jgi:hypothetical protein
MTEWRSEWLEDYERRACEQLDTFLRTEPDAGGTDVDEAIFEISAILPGGEEMLAFSLAAFPVTRELRVPGEMFSSYEEGEYPLAVLSLAWHAYFERLLVEHATAQGRPPTPDR